MGALSRSAAARSARIAAVCALAAAGAVIGLLALGHSVSAPAIAPSAPVEVAASFDPAVPQFGDSVNARVVVALDPRLVQPNTLALSDGLAPLTQLGPVRMSRSTQGKLELMTVVVPVSCLSSSCVAKGGVASIKLPRVQASVKARDGHVEHASAAWPTLSVRGRVSASDLNASSPPFQSNTSPPAASYRIAPGTLATLLELLAALCAVGAIGLAGWQVHRSFRGRVRQPGALEVALRLTREAERRPVPDRRRALALLGRALGRDQRSGAARRLAWSESAPEPAELEELVSDVEQGGPG